MLNSEYFEDVLAHVYKNTANYIGLGPLATTTKQKLSPILDLQGIASILQNQSNSALRFLFMPLVASHQKM
jgi:thiamine-phosphate pyrophosphorylase